MLTHHRKYIFLDLETTGPNPAADMITEIGLVEVTRDGVGRWSTLINPQVPIPPFIQHLTGITDDMAREAPVFSERAAEVRERLQGGLLIAHNARFDYGFLRNAYQRLGQSFRCEVLCTIKLSRRLFPEEIKHGLDALMERHGLAAHTRHRALADADLLWQFWRKLEATIPAPTLLNAIETVLQRPNIPVQLSPELLDDIPEGPGVYLFFGEGDAPLFVGKASRIRPRVLSHVVTDRLSARDLRLAQQIERIEWHETAGEVGAALLEAKLVRQLRPAYNRAVDPAPEHCAWQLCESEGGGLQPVLAFTRDLDFGKAERLYGLFNTRAKAEMALQGLSARHGVDLLQTSTDAGGAKDYNERIQQALAPLALAKWPYPGPAGVIETAADGRQDIHLIDHWRYLGTARSDEDLACLLAHPSDALPFDADTYRILSRALAAGQLRFRPISADSSA